jgi:hypothetical protein
MIGHGAGGDLALGGGGLSGLGLFHALVPGPINGDVEGDFKVTGCDEAGAKNARSSGLSQVHHGGFEASGTSSPIEEIGDIARVEGMSHMVGGGGAEALGAISGRGSNGALSSPNQNQGYGMVRHTNGDRGIPSGDLITHSRSPGQDKGQGTRPEVVGQFLSPGGHGSFKRGNNALGQKMAETGSMDDKRIGGGSALCGENTEDSLGGGGVSPEAVHGFCGEGHKPPLLDGDSSTIQPTPSFLSPIGRRTFEKNPPPGNRAIRGILSAKLACDRAGGICGAGHGFALHLQFKRVTQSQNVERKG